MSQNDMGGGYLAIMPVSDIEAIVQSTFGLSLEDFSSGIPESWLFYQGNKSYYAHYETKGREEYQYTVRNFTINGVELLEEDLVRVYYTPSDSSSYLNGQPMAVTLRAAGDGGYRVVSNQKVVSEDQTYTTLTLEQVEQVNEAFEEIRTWKEGNLTMGGATPINGFFQCYYNSPEEIDLRQFLRHFSAYGIVEGWGEDAESVIDWKTTVTEQELQDLILLEDWPFDHVAALKDMPVPIHKMRSEDIDAVLMYYTGVHLDELDHIGKDSGVLYSEEYDSYYNFTSDFGPGYFNCTGGRIYDGYVELYSESAVLILREVDGHYYIYSHLPIE